MKIVIATGGFDPLHEGHIAYLNEAKTLGDILVVGLNSDVWLIRKKGQNFQTYKTRSTIIKNLRMVNDIITFDDSDDSSIDAIIQTKEKYGPYHEYIFVNGGDRTANNIPEMVVPDVTFAFGIGGYHKMNSSSWILDRFKDGTN